MYIEHTLPWDSKMTVGASDGDLTLISQGRVTSQPMV